MDLVSIISPVYNTNSKFLVPCIESIINQTYQNLEIIFVNDGSTKDHVLLLLTSYAEKDSRIKILNQSNTGMIEARQNGVNLSTGKYIMFIDSDDYLELNAIELLLNKAISTNAGVVIGGYWQVFQDKKIEHLCKVHPPFSKTLDLIKAIFVSDIPTSVWGRLIEKDVWNKANIHLPSFLRHLDDFLANLLFFQSIDKDRVQFIDNPLYYYIQVSGSTLHTNSTNTHKSAIYIFDWVNDFAKTTYPDELENEIDYFNLTMWCGFLYNNMKLAQTPERRALLKKGLKNMSAKKKLTKSQYLTLFCGTHFPLNIVYRHYLFHIKPALKNLGVFYNKTIQ